jgi:hypothetical protein
MFTDGFVISSPITSDNLSVFLIHGDEQTPDTSFLTLDEALRHKLLIVHETGSVGELAVENLSSSVEVFIQAGDIVKGGLQDRVLAYDVIVPPKSGRVPVGAYCVESARWNKRGGEDAVSFMRSSDRAHSGLRQAFLSKSQSEVWNRVEQAQDRLSARLGKDVRSAYSETSFQLTLEDKDLEKRTKQYVDSLIDIVKAEATAVGCAVAINGKVMSAEVYSSRSLFARLWPKMLKANAVEAVSESDKKEFVAASIDDIHKYLNDAQGERATEQRVPPRVQVLVRETPRTVCEETRDEGRGGQWIHRSWVANDSEGEGDRSHPRHARGARY